MKRSSLAVLLIALLAAPTAAEEQLLSSRIASIGLFKNGLAVVERTATLQGPGTYRLDDVPEPVHGTYWIQSDAKVVTRLTTRAVEVPVDRAGGADFQEELAGKSVTIHFADQGIPPTTGTVLALQPARGGDAWNRAYQQPRYGYGYSNARYGNQNVGAMLVLKTDKGRAYVSTSRIAYLQAADPGDTVRRRKPVLLLSVQSADQRPATVSITYLAKGMAWAPSYCVDISDPKKLLLRQKAVLKNELEPIDGARVQLISGFPSIQFANVTSPLSLRTTWSDFFQQLNKRYSAGHASMRNVVTQQVAFNAPSPDAGIDLSAIPTGEGVDLHYQDIGRQTLDEGDSLSLETASSKADYERIVEWIVPDTRQASGHYIPEHQRQQQPEKYQDAAWDAVRFRNPLDFPMTTAPAMVVSQGRFNGQRLSYWVNPGEQTTLHVTKALSIRTRNVEREVDGNRETVYVGGTRYRKTMVEGDLRVSNHRAEEITLVIRRRFSGKLISADGDPKSSLLEEGVWSVNQRNQLTWNLSLKPAEETKLVYRYSVLVRH